MDPSDSIPNGIGQPVRRKEDFRLLAGRGSFADDVRLPEMAHAVIMRSPVDALAELGVRHIEMPATPERVWRALRAVAARKI